MKTPFIRAVVGLSLGLLFLVAFPAQAGSSRATGSGHTGFSGGARGGSTAHGYSGTGIIRGLGSYGEISTGRYGNYGAYGQRYYAPRSSTGTQIYGSSARSQGRTASRQFATSPSRSGSYYVPRDQSGVGFARKPGIQQRAGTTAKSAIRPDGAWSRQNAANRQRIDPQTTQRLRNWQGKAPGYADAKRHHQEHWQDRHHHDHDWWRHHCEAIVFVGGGFWGWYDGWWYPAWGYDPYYSYYDYNGPIYGYDGLRPDEVIADVQAALQQLGYYGYAVDGVLGPATEAAIANYQRDYGLVVTGAIDPPTARSLGLGS
jgi:hypothetical protein